MPDGQGSWLTNERILVRGPDGKLYALSKTGAPSPLTAEEEQAVAEVIDQASDWFTQHLKDAVPRFDFGRSQVRLPEL
jgi:hypothetical protein